MARKKTRKRATKRVSTKFTRCKYVGKRGSKKVADKLARELKRDGFRAIVSKGIGGAVAAGYDVFSCGRLAKARKRLRRR